MHTRRLLLFYVCGDSRKARKGEAFSSVPGEEVVSRICGDSRKVRKGAAFSSVPGEEG